MVSYNLPFKNEETLLALGAESAGNFAVWKNGILHHSEDYGDLLELANWNKFEITLSEFLKKEKIKPDVVLTDLHPLFKTTVLGKILAKKYKAELIQVQHHIAHIFSAVADEKIRNSKFETCLPVDKVRNSFVGIALDGTGFGLDGKIWGGEIFKISNFQFPISNKIPSTKFQISRIGHMENQVMIGGELAIKEPARIIIAVLSKFLKKNDVYKHIKKYYSKQQFEVLYSQLQQNFNCIETSSTARVLDAVSLLLGFCGNERKYKHEPVALLEANSEKPYANIRPKINEFANQKSRIGNYELDTIFLFEYLIKNLRKDKKRLAATAQLYIARSLYEIIKKSQVAGCGLQEVYLSGGLANNKIISSYLKSKDIYISNIIPRGDAGIAAGQIGYYLLANSRD